MAGFLTLVSAGLGWVYTLCWSASFYPQFILNYHRKTTSGSTVDFPFINVLGAPPYLHSSRASPLRIAVAALALLASWLAADLTGPKASRRISCPTWRFITRPSCATSMQLGTTA